MGKRKLRFHVRKNYERNRPPIKLIVSIPLLSLPQNDSCIANDPPTSSTHLVWPRLFVARGRESARKSLVTLLYKTAKSCIAVSPDSSLPAEEAWPD